MKRLSIKWKIFSYLICFCALLLVILWLLQTVLLGTFYRAIKVSEIKSNAATISKNIEDENLPAFLDTLAQGNDYYIIILNLSGIQLMQSGNRKDGLPPEQLTSLIKKLDNGEYLEYMSGNYSLPKDQVKFSDIPPQDGKGTQSIVYLKQTGSKIILINSMISPVDATVTTLRYQLYVITAIMLILSIILAIIIAKRVSAPIEKLNGSAKVLATGDYNVAFDNTGYREIAELSDTLNVAAVELNKVETLRKELMANISHDLRTPLSLIYAYAEMMHDFPQDISGDQTQTIMDETQRLSSLVNDVLDISNLEAGTQKLNNSVFNLTQSIKTTTDHLAELVKNQGYTITFEYDEEILVNADEIKIKQAFYNLLINAINYTGNDKIARVRQISDDRFVRIEVSDSGEGIPEENLKYIWDRYYKIDKSHKRPVTGTGLGLSIVKKIIQMLGGEYGVTSQVGTGSTFWFSLPRNFAK